MRALLILTLVLVACDDPTSLDTDPLVAITAWGAPGCTVDLAVSSDRPATIYAVGASTAADGSLAHLWDGDTLAEVFRVDFVEPEYHLRGRMQLPGVTGWVSIWLMVDRDRTTPVTTAAYCGE